MTWQARAACKGWPTSLFFPGRGEAHEHDHVPRVVEPVCAGCQVRDECLEEGLRNHASGVWGGTSEKQRKQIRRRRGRKRVA